MNSNQNTSTPKRRRLGTGRILLSQNRVSREENTGILKGVSPITFKKPYSVSKSPERCESPHLPCNQVEYLCDSDNSSGGVSFLDNPVTGDWESLVVSTNNLRELGEHEESRSNHNAVGETDNISDDMFHSKLELENSWRGLDGVNNHVQSASALKIDKVFEEDIEQSFDIINESICNLDTNANKELFETKDSFLLDIKESGIVAEEAKINNNVKIIKDHDSFYGLPKVTQQLFKTYRNIEKFYDWQEECLNLDAIKERRNLIYALPTSGGKTLVAEILMLREVMNRKRNALFILPFVAIVQEKIWALSPFALQLEFLVEEYAAGKGHIPPKKRRKKNSIYIATIEKALAVIRSLIELNRLDELGLIVVDELHLIGEKGRGGTLETLLSTVIFTNKNIQIVGMSATIGNLPDIAQFLKAEVYQCDFRPVELTEYVKLGGMLYKIVWGDSMEVVPDRKLAYDYSAAGSSLDPDLLGGLVGEVVPGGSCLVFCPTKRNCENVTLLLCKLQRREMLSHRMSERNALAAALRAEGSGGALVGCVRCGLGWHHAGLAADERAMLEQGFRSGVISVLCCTSTLAAGVNLPARRVVIRAPRVGRDLITLGGYRQMAGRAGRAGVCEQGESILVCPEHEWPLVRGVLSGGLGAARSVLGGAALGALLLGAVGLRLATTRPALGHLLGHTLLAVDCQYSPTVDIKSQCDNALKALLKSGALEVVNKESSKDDTCLASDDGNFYVHNHSELAVSRLGKAAIKGCLDLSVASQLLQDLEVASRSLVLMGSLHLIYLVTPHDAAGIKPDYRHYYSLYTQLDEEGLQTAKILGITEMTAIKMMTGKPITNVSERVLCRFYLALMLHDLWKQVPFPTVAEKYSIPRGTVQSVMSSAAALASSAQRACDELQQRWAFRALFADLAPRLQHCAAPELTHLMELPAVKKARAVQLMRAGYKRIEDLAKASVEDLVASVAHLSKTAASHLVSAARLMLIEKVENLRAEAEDVMEDLKKS